MAQLESETPSATERPARSRQRRFRLHPIIVRVLAWMGTCWAILGLFLSPVLPGGWWFILVATLLSAAPLLGLRRWFGGVATPSAWARLFVIRPFWYTQLALPLLVIAGVFGGLVGLIFATAGYGGRIAITIVAVIFALGMLAGWVGSRWLVVRQLDVRLQQLPPALAGLRIVQVSDLHVGPQTSRRHLARIAAAVHAAHPDLIAITGDQVDDYAADAAHFARAFGDLTAPLGVYAIAGNHDVYAGWDAVRAGLEQMGIRVLVNEAVQLQHNGAAFWLAGTGDPAGTSVQRGTEKVAPDLVRTMADVAPADFSIVLAHNPVLWPPLAQAGADLTLSGHTHHGQLSIPRLGWSMASPFLKHAMGAHREGPSLLYINPGTNFWGIPFRIGALPEVSVLTLRSAATGENSIEAAQPETLLHPLLWIFCGARSAPRAGEFTGSPCAPTTG